MPDRSIWGCPSRYRRLSTASVASLLRQNSKPAIADNALFPRLFRASQVYICRKTFGYLLSRLRLRPDGTEDPNASRRVEFRVLMKLRENVMRFPAVAGGRFTRLGCVLMPGQV